MSLKSDSSSLGEDVEKVATEISTPEMYSAAMDSVSMYTGKMSSADIANAEMYLAQMAREGMSSAEMFSEEMSSEGMSSKVMVSATPEVQFYKRWWGFELHCNESAVGLINGLRDLVLEVVSKFLPPPLPTLISVYTFVRQEVIKGMSQGYGVKLVSPWTSPLMLSPRPLNNGEILPQQDTAMRWSVFESGSWSDPQMFPAHHSYTAPAVAEHNGRLVCVHRGGANDERLWYAIYEPETGWSDDQQISGQSSRQSPALATFQGMLYCAYRGQSGDERLFWTVFNGRSWSQGKALDHGSGSRSNPSLAGFNGYLYCVHRAHSGSEYLWMTRFNGSSWSPGVRIPHNMSSREGPALCAFRSRLYIVSRGQSGDERLLWMSTADGTTWTQPQPVSNNQSDYRPGLAVLNDKLVCAYRGRSVNGLWTSTFNGSQWTQAQPMTGHQSQSEPDLAFYRDGNTPGSVENHGEVKDQIICVYRGIKR